MVCCTVVGGSPKSFPHSLLQEVRWQEALRICGRWWWRFTQHYVSTKLARTITNIPSPPHDWQHQVLLNSLERRVDSCIEVRGRGEGAPGGRARGLPDDRQLQRPASVQAGRRGELHLLLRRLLLLACRSRGWSPVRLAAQHNR